MVGLRKREEEVRTLVFDLLEPHRPTTPAFLRPLGGEAFHFAGGTQIKEAEVLNIGFAAMTSRPFVPEQN